MRVKNNPGSVPTFSNLKLELNKMEHYFFFKRTIGGASATEYIGSSTFRGWRSKPHRKGIISYSLQDAYGPLIKSFNSFVQRFPQPTREQFDRFHEQRVNYLYKFLNPYSNSTYIFPAAKGSYPSDGKFSYNVYAKVIDLAYSHWCFRQNPTHDNALFTRNASLRNCLHVPLDSKVISDIRRIATTYQSQLPTIELPQDGMGSIKSQDDYKRVQQWIRFVADAIPSTNFKGFTVAPLAFDTYK